MLRGSTQIRIAWSVWALCAIAAALFLYVPKIVPTHDHVSTFRLPTMFLACFEIELADNETMYDWDMEQPSVIKVGANSTVYVNGGMFRACPFHYVFYVGKDAALLSPAFTVSGSAEGIFDVDSMGSPVEEPAR